jgi:3-hydroxyisobutyrate dehydrogenase-like beta-hydroxyacid dehydrogenase
MTRVGLAGLGRMGAPMATNLAAAGFEVVLWNRTIETAERLAREIDATVCSTPRELAERSDCVITMLADDDSSVLVHEGDDGLFAADGGASHMLAMGTLSPGHVRRLAEQAGERTVIDAPVSGSIDAARDAQLMIMAGADEATLEAVRPVLTAMSREIICLGAIGAGATMKLAVNMLIHGLNQTVAEALTLAEAAGIDPSLAYEAFEQSAAAAPMLHYRKPQYLDEAANPVSFALSLAGKDVALAIDLGAELGVPLPQAQLNLDQLNAAEADGFGDRDMASMVNYLRGSR